MLKINRSLMVTALPSVKRISAFKDNRVLLFKAAVVIASVVALYYSDLALIFGNALEFTTGNITNYVITIPLMSAFIIYRKRSILRVVALRTSGNRPDSVRIDDVLGITLCVIAFIIYLSSSATLYALEYHILSLPIFLAGGTVLVFNIQTFRHAIVAILLTLYIQPPPGQLVSELAADLSWTSAVIVEGLLRSLGLPISLDTSFGAPALILENAEGNRTPFFVGEPSSGVFSTIGLSLFAVFVAYIIRGPTWKRILLFISGFPVFFLLNTLRIAMVLTLWYLWGQDVSEAYHTISGSSMVAIGTIIVLLVGEKVFKLKIRSEKKKVDKCNLCDKYKALYEPMCLYCGNSVGKIKQSIGKSAERIAVLAFVTFVAIALTVANVNNVDASRKLSDLDINKIEGPETVEYFFPAVAGWDQEFAYRDNRIESILSQDAALAYRYLPVSSGADTPTSSASVFASVQISTGHHIWEDSLVTHPSRVGRPGATLLVNEDVDISGDAQGRFLLFKRVGSTSTEAVLYWFERTPLKFGTNFENRNVLISIWANADAMAKNGIVSQPDDSVGIKAFYLSLAKPIADYWDEQSARLDTSELLFSFFSQNIQSLLIVVVTLLALFLSYTHVKRWALSSKKYTLYQRLVLEDKSFMDTLNTPDIRKFATGYFISRKYHLATGKLLEEGQVVQTLSSARNSGLIKNEVMSVRDEPLLVWRPTFTVKKPVANKIADFTEKTSPFKELFKLKWSKQQDQNSETAF